MQLILVYAGSPRTSWKVTNLTTADVDTKLQLNPFSYHRCNLLTSQAVFSTFSMQDCVVYIADDDDVNFVYKTNLID